MLLNILHLYIITDRKIEETPSQLRGFIGMKFRKYPEVHHHKNSDEVSKLIYSYPKIQYKINNNRAIILGIGNKNIDILKKVVLNVKKLELGKNIYDIQEIKVHLLESEFKAFSDQDRKLYTFITPWIALNVKNYKRFQKSNITERRELLNKILIGNILSISKYLGYTVSIPLSVDLEVYPTKVQYKSIDLIGFKGNFNINFSIPDYLGIGKAVSHGFGTIKQIID